MSEFEKQLHNMFDRIWDCDINHPVYEDTVGELMEEVIRCYKTISSERNSGHWIRMPYLLEDEYDRYQCSYCKNIVYHKNKINLYTFTRYCGRCGSDNGNMQRGKQNE